jgi:phosphotransferase system enzyme I (PtsI)
MYTRRKVLKGLSISSGIALGQALLIRPSQLTVAERPIPVSGVNTEIKALEQAVANTLRELEELRSSAGKKMAGSMTKIFDAQLLIANDQDFLKQVKGDIAKRLRNAGFVYDSLVQETVLKLGMSSDPYMRQMVPEIESVTKRVLSHLGGYGERSTARLPQDTILVANSFTASDILSYRNRRAVGFLAAEGGAHSHMALIARSLMIPMAVIKDGCVEIPPNCRLIVDGTDGLVIVNPTDKDWTDYQDKRKRLGPALLSRIKRLTEIPPRTIDGVPVHIEANLEIPGPADDILSERRIPVGLYRTEFLYLESEAFPDEEAQYAHYLRIAEKFADTFVILRTFDLGSDKIKADGFIPHEDNPALGWRGIRSMLELPDIFKTQIRAMLRASVYSNVKILLPMVSDVTELTKARRLISQAMLELRRDKATFDQDVEIGVMVEVPSAALTIEQFVKYADFVSIGTNDLTQYTMSADRGNARVAGLYNHFHPSVLRLIAMTVDACKKQKKPVHICGEAAGDPLGLPLFVGMGVSGLSMNPTKIVDSCRLISKIDYDLVRHLVAPILASNSVSAVMRKLESFRNALENK